MTSEYNAPNIDLQVRTIIAAAAGVSGPEDGILSTNELEAMLGRGRAHLLLARD